MNSVMKRVFSQSSKVIEGAVVVYKFLLSLVLTAFVFLGLFKIENPRDVPPATQALRVFGLQEEEEEERPMLFYGDRRKTSVELRLRHSKDYNRVSPGKDKKVEPPCSLAEFMAQKPQKLLPRENDTVNGSSGSFSRTREDSLTPSQAGFLLGDMDSRHKIKMQRERQLHSDELTRLEWENDRLSKEIEQLRCSLSLKEKYYEDHLDEIKGRHADVVESLQNRHKNELENEAERRDQELEEKMFMVNNKWKNESSIQRRKISQLEEEIKNLNYQRNLADIDREEEYQQMMKMMEESGQQITEDLVKDFDFHLDNIKTEVAKESRIMSKEFNENFIALRKSINRMKEVSEEGYSKLIKAQDQIMDERSEGLEKLKKKLQIHLRNTEERNREFNEDIEKCCWDEKHHHEIVIKQIEENQNKSKNRDRELGGKIDERLDTLLEPFQEFQEDMKCIEKIILDYTPITKKTAYEYTNEDVIGIVLGL